MYSALLVLPRECHIAFGACLESFWSGVKSPVECITKSSIYEKMDNTNS